MTSCGLVTDPGDLEFQEYLILDKEFRDNVYARFASTVNDTEVSLADISESFNRPSTAFPSIERFRDYAASNPWLATVFDDDVRFEVLSGSPTRVKILRRISDFEYRTVLTPGTSSALYQDQPLSFHGLVTPPHLSSTGAGSVDQLQVPDQSNAHSRSSSAIDGYCEKRFAWYSEKCEKVTEHVDPKSGQLVYQTTDQKGDFVKRTVVKPHDFEETMIANLFDPRNHSPLADYCKKQVSPKFTRSDYTRYDAHPMKPHCDGLYPYFWNEKKDDLFSGLCPVYSNYGIRSKCLKKTLFNAAEGFCMHEGKKQEHICVLCKRPHCPKSITYSNRGDCDPLHGIIENLEQLGIDSESLKKVISDKRKFDLKKHIFEDCLSSKQKHHQPKPIVHSRPVHADVDRIGDRIAHDIANRQFVTRFVPISPKKPLSSLIIDADALLEYAYESPMHSKQLEDNVGDIFQLFSIIEDKLHQICSFFGFQSDRGGEFDGFHRNSRSVGTELSKLVVFFSDASTASWDPALRYARVLLVTFLKTHLSKYVVVYRASDSDFRTFMDNHVHPFHNCPELAPSFCFMGSCSNRSSSLLLWFASIHYFSVYIFQDHIINQNKFLLFILEQTRYRSCDERNERIFQICGARYLEQFRVNAIEPDALSCAAPFFQSNVFDVVRHFLGTTGGNKVFIEAFTFAHEVSLRVSFIVRLKNTMDFNRFKKLNPDDVKVMLKDLSPVARDVFEHLTACLLKSPPPRAPPAFSCWPYIDLWDSTALQVHRLLQVHGRIDVKSHESLFQDFCSGKLLKDLFRNSGLKDDSAAKSKLSESDRTDSVANQTTFHFSSKIDPRGLPYCFARYAQHANDGTPESMWHSACRERQTAASDADMEAKEALMFGASIRKKNDPDGRIIFCECISTNGECKWCKNRGAKDGLPPLNSPTFAERYGLFTDLRGSAKDQECVLEFLSNVVFKTKENPTQLVCDAWDKFLTITDLQEPFEHMFWRSLGRTCALRWAPYYIHSKAEKFCLAYVGLTNFWVENCLSDDACAASMFRICVLNSGEALRPVLGKFLSSHGSDVVWSSFHHHQIENHGSGKKDILGLFVPDSWQCDVLDCVPNPFDFSQLASASSGTNVVQTSVRSAVVQAPTSAGKTFLSLEIMRRFIYNSIQKSVSTKDLVVYICPTKPLANMVYRDIANKFYQILKTEHHIAGMFVKGLNLWVERCKVLVTVPQMLDTLLWDASQLRLQRNISCLIVDEVHLITDPELGPVLERIFTTSSCPIYAFSGTVSGVSTFCDWIRKCERREVVEIPRHDIKSSLKQRIPRYTDLQFLQLCKTKTGIDGPASVASRELHPWCHIRYIDEFDSALPDLPSILPEMLYTSLSWILDCGTELWQHLCRSLGLGDKIESVDDLLERWFPVNAPDRAEWFVTLRNHVEKMDFVLRGVIKSADQECRKKLIKVVQTSTYSHRESPVHVDDGLNYVFRRNLFPCIAIQPSIPSCKRLFRDAQKLLSERKIREYKILPWRFSFHYDQIKGTLDEIDSEEVQQKLMIEFNYDTSELKCFIEGIKHRVAFHNGKMPALARSYVEQLLDLGYFLIVSATTTLATGMNTPCKCVLFPLEHFFLESAPFLQGSGRAGRRGIEDRGIVVCCNFNSRKLHQRFIDIPDIKMVGHLPMNTSMILKMLFYLNELTRKHSSEVLGCGYKSIQLMLNNPMFMATRTDRDDETTNQLKNGWHTTIVANLQVLRILGCVNRYAEPCAFSYLASQFSYKEPAGLVMSFAVSPLFLPRNEDESNVFWKTREHGHSWQFVNVIRILRIFHASSHSYSGTRDLFSGAELQPKVEMEDLQSYLDFFAFNPSRTYLPPAHHNSLLHLAESFNAKLATVWDIVSKQLQSKCPDSWVGDESALQEMFPLSHACLRGPEMFPLSHACPRGPQPCSGGGGDPLFTWKSVASLWTSQDEATLIGSHMPDKLIHVTDMCSRKITQLHEVCPFVDAKHLAYSLIENLIPLILCNNFLSAHDICTLLNPPQRLETVSRMILEQREDLRKIKTCLNDAKELESMTHTPEYRASFKERLRELAMTVHCKNGTSKLQDAVILVCLPCTEDVTGETQSFLSLQFRKLFGFYLGKKIEPAQFILTVCFSTLQKDIMCHLCTGRCNAKKLASIQRAFDLMDFQFAPGIDGDKLWNAAAEFSQMAITRIRATNVFTSDGQTAASGFCGPSHTPSSSSSSASCNSVAWYGISDSEHNSVGIKKLLEQKIVQQLSSSKVRVWFPPNPDSNFLVRGIDQAQFNVVKNLQYDISNAYSDFFEWSLFCFLHPLHRLLLECGIVLSCDPDPDARETQEKYDLTGGALMLKISRIVKPADDLTDAFEPDDSKEESDGIVFDVQSFDIQRIDFREPLPKLRFCFLRNFVGTPQYMMDLYRRLEDMVCFDHKKDQAECSTSADVKFLYVPRDTSSGQLFLSNLFGFDFFSQDRDSLQWILSVFVIKKPHGKAFVRAQFCKGCVCKPPHTLADCKCCDKRVARLFQKKPTFMKESGFEISTSPNDFELLQRHASEFFDRIVSSIDSDVSSSDFKVLTQEIGKRKEASSIFHSFFQGTRYSSVSSDQGRRAHVSCVLEDHLWAQNIAIHPNKYVFDNRQYLSEDRAKNRTSKALLAIFSSIRNVEKEVDHAISNVGSDMDECIKFLNKKKLCALGMDKKWINYPHTPGYLMFRNLLAASYCCLQGPESSPGIFKSGVSKIHQVEFFQSDHQRSELFHYFHYPENKKHLKQMSHTVVIIGEPLKVVIANAVSDGVDVDNSVIQSFEIKDLQHPSHVLHYYGALEYPIQSPYFSTFLPLLHHLIMKDMSVLILPGDLSDYVPEGREAISAGCSRLISVLEENCPNKNLTFVTFGDCSAQAAKEYIQSRKHGNIFEAYEANGSFYDRKTRCERTKWLEELAGRLDTFIKENPQQLPRHGHQEPHVRDPSYAMGPHFGDEDETQLKMTEIIRWPDGKRKWECDYVAGLKNGIETCFLPDGITKASTCEYICGQKHGFEKHYFPDGSTRKRECEYVAGTKKWESDWENGSLAYFFNVFKNSEQYTFRCSIPSVEQ